MSRTVRGFLAASAAALTCSMLALAGCSSESRTSSSDDDLATPDGSFCSLLVAFRDSNASLDAEFNSGDTDRAKSAITRLVRQADLLRSKAPAEIKADIDVVAVYISGLDQLFARYDYDIDAFADNEKASAEFAVLDSDEVESSLLQMRVYAEADCASDSESATTTTLAP